VNVNVTISGNVVFEVGAPTTTTAKTVTSFETTSTTTSISTTTKTTTTTATSTLNPWRRFVQPTTPDSLVLEQIQQEPLEDSSEPNQDLGLILGITALIVIVFFFLLLVNFFYF
jgi:hypothetical protein